MADRSGGPVLWRTVGHEAAVNALQRSLREGRLSHAYLLVGPRHVGKMTLAIDLAQAVNCLEEEVPCGRCNQCRRIADGIHADVHVVGVDSSGARDGRGRVAISIDQVREVQRQASLKPYEGRYRVFIFDGAEHLSEEGANSLLKILEEPPEQVILVMLALDAEGLLPTIVSRCQRLNLRPAPLSLVTGELESRYSVDHDKAEQIVRLSGGRLGWAIQAVSQPDMLDRHLDRLRRVEEIVQAGLERRFAYAANLASGFADNRESVRQELDLWLQWWRDVLAAKEGALELVTNLSRADTVQAVAEALSSSQIVRAIRSVRGTIEHLELNVNPRLALEELMLALPDPGQ